MNITNSVLGLSYLVLIQRGQNTGSVCYLFLYGSWEVHGDSKICSCLSKMWLEVILSGESCLLCQMGSSMHNSVNATEQENQQESLNFPIQWTIKDYHAP